jgi:broad-specificity NMP kinase
MKILITGVAGTGKSTLSNLLNTEGIISIDVSAVPNLCYWREKTTHNKIEFGKERNEKWFELNERICDPAYLSTIINNYSNIVLCGSFSNIFELLYLFDKVILLQCNYDELIVRLRRRNSDFGKTIIEQNIIKKWQKVFDPQMLSFGAIHLNTNAPIKIVLENIIHQINDLYNNNIFSYAK